MANSANKKEGASQSSDLQAGDPLFNLHHAQAEAELVKNTGGLGPTTNVYVSSDEEDTIEDATTPRDSQGFVRGQNASNNTGSSAGEH